MSSAVSMIATRQPPAPDVMPKKEESFRISSTDRTFISLPGAFVHRAAQDQKPRMRARRNLLADRIVGRDRKILRALRRCAEAQQIARDAIGKRRLADARRPGDQPRLRRPSAADRAGGARQCLAVTGEFKDLARMRLTLDAVGLWQGFGFGAFGHARS